MTLVHSRPTLRVELLYYWRLQWVVSSLSCDGLGIALFGSPLYICSVHDYL